MFIRPYSILLIALPLSICGAKFIIIHCTTWDCRNYGDFVRTDMGMKPKRTFSSGENFKLTRNILKPMGQNKNKTNMVLQQYQQ
jgi:hypothetical protein